MEARRGDLRPDFVFGFVVMCPFLLSCCRMEGQRLSLSLTALGRRRIDRWAARGCHCCRGMSNALRGTRSPPSRPPSRRTRWRRCTSSTTSSASPSSSTASPTRRSSGWPCSGHRSQAQRGDRVRALAQHLPPQSS